MKLLGHQNITMQYNYKLSSHKIMIKCFQIVLKVTEWSQFKLQFWFQI